MSSSVNIVRLTSGEEIVCLLTISGDTYFLGSPAIIVPTGDGNIGLMRWLAYSTAVQVQVSKKYVVFVVQPVAELAKKYLLMTSEIVLPPVKEIITP